MIPFPNEDVTPPVTKIYLTLDMLALRFLAIVTGCKARFFQTINPILFRTDLFGVTVIEMITRNKGYCKPFDYKKESFKIIFKEFLNIETLYFTIA